jgi:hypothetical protein
MYKTALIVQPGAYGDIFICAPIAKWYYDLGYKVYWPVRKQFLSTLEYFSYVKPIILSEDKLHEDWLRSDVMKIIPTFDKYDIILNLADRGPHSTAQQNNENFEICKYRLSNVPFETKNTLIWKRNIQKENELIKLMQLPEKYSLVHNKDSLREEAVIPAIQFPIVKIEEIEGYNIPDWFGIMEKAEEIYCIESAIHQFIDGAIHKLPNKKYLLKRKVVQEGTRFTVSSNWDLKYIGEKSIIKG